MTKKQTELAQVLDITQNLTDLLCERDKKILFRFAQEVPEKGTIVDIGTCNGGSAFIMALASKPSVRVFTIDPREREEFLSLRDRLGLTQKITFIHAASKKAFVKWENGMIDLLFVDGDHSKKGVISDFKTFGSRVKKGSPILFHDTISYKNTVGKVVPEFEKTGFIKILKIENKDDKEIGMEVAIKI